MAQSFHGPHVPTNQPAIPIEIVNATLIPNPALPNLGNADEVNLKKEKK